MAINSLDLQTINYSLEINEPVNTTLDVIPPNSISLTLGAEGLQGPQGPSGGVDSVTGTVPTGMLISQVTTGDVTFDITFDVGYSLVTSSEKSNWNTAYSWGDHSVAGYLLESTYNSDPASSITSLQVTNWDTAYSWGDHSVAGYLLESTYNADAASSITSLQVTNWDTAYSWGDHSSQGYAKYGDTIANFEGALRKSGYNVITTNDIGSSVQAYDIDLQTIASLSVFDGAFMVGSSGGTWSIEAGSTARASLGLTIGSDVQAYSSNLTSWAAKAVPSGTVVGTTDSQTLTNKTLTDPSVIGTITEDVYTITTGSLTLNPSNGSIQVWTLSTNGSASDSLSSGEAITLMIDDGAGYTITWPSITWVNNGGAAPTLATTGYTVVTLWKVSTTLYGALVGDGT